MKLSIAEEDSGFPPEAATERPKRQRAKLRAVGDEPLPAAFGQDELSDAWLDRYAQDWIFCQELDRWYEWNGAQWERLLGNKHFNLTRQITREALSWPGGSELSARDKRAVNSASTAATMLRIIRAHPEIEITAKALDADPLLLGVPNGVLDLRRDSCKIITAERGHHITKRCGVAPALGNPTRWLEFLQQVTNDDKDLIEYLQRFSGYCLTGLTNEHALAFLYGTGANGKTTFVETLLYIMGDYGIATGMETLSEAHGDKHTTEIARFMGARMIAAEETSSGAKWNEGRIKRLTGGGRIAARFMRCDDIEFDMQGKFLIAGNHKPSLRADEAMKRRIHLVPFTVTIPEGQRDRDLMAKLKAEAPQILAWMVQGCAAWHDYGLAPGERIRDATEKYIVSNDILGAWIDDRTEPTEDNSLNDGRILYADFAQWCEEQQEGVWKRRTWSDAMISRGFEDDRTKHMRGFRGVKLRAPTPNTASPKQTPDYYKK